MKKLFKLLILSAAVVVSSSCSKDYLDTTPTDSTGTGTIFENVTNMEMAVNGLYKRMVIQYSNFSSGYNNGEAVMKMWCGDIAGNNMSVMNFGNVGFLFQYFNTFLQVLFYLRIGVVSRNQRQRFRTCSQSHHKTVTISSFRALAH